MGSYILEDGNQHDVRRIQRFYPGCCWMSYPAVLLADPSKPSDGPRFAFLQTQGGAVVSPPPRSVDNEHNRSQSKPFTVD
jgi:hypothetical protein